MTPGEGSGAPDHRQAFVHAARLALRKGADPRAPGAAVTLALCGSGGHPPPCRWPHNNDLDHRAAPAAFRTVFVALPGDEARVREVIADALLAADQWEVLDEGPTAVADGDLQLAGRLLRPQD